MIAAGALRHDVRVVSETAAWLRATLPAGARLCSDSRTVSRGDAFFAYPGERSDGRRHIGQALERGASAVVWERDGFSWPQAMALPQRPVPGLKPLCGPIAASFLDRPTERMDVVAVTGTNGKTSCTQWIAEGLQRLGRPSAVIGTLGAGRPGALADFGLTTPDALALQHLFARLAGEGIADVAIEASSIGLAQGRLEGTRIAVAVYTNLSRDHLDHHGTLQAYAQAKARLFAWPGLKAVVVNLDDPWAATMLAGVSPGVVRMGYRIDGGGDAAAAPRVDRLLRARAVTPGLHGMAIDIAGDFGAATVTTSLIGRFNVSNLLAVAGAWLALGVPFDDVVSRLPVLASVPGRLQALPSRDGEPLVVVDYAHTPDALANALDALRAVAAARGGHLWCVFGAGGDRDPGKRPEMGAVAQRGADHVVLTSDNPRSEAPGAILDAIRAGMATPPRAVEPDRARAIAGTVADAGPRDVVLIAGKGHEPYQEVAGRRLPFSDLEHAAAALRARATGGRDDA